jgi:glutamyl-tRNA synthetase
MEKARVRFAPSPTGFLHVGNARTALFNWLFARQRKGAFILRVEDTDIQRSAKEYEERLKEDLHWLGLDWDEGPDEEGLFGPYRQSLRLPIYEEYTQKLLQEKKAFYCFCSPQELEEERKKAIAAGEMPVYSGKCRHISLEEANERIQKGEKAAVRLKTPEKGDIGYRDLVRGTLSFDMELIGDPILVRSNGLPAYNYAVVIDDSLMKITHVIRGEDHISNTPRQILIYRALGFDLPQFAHLAMVMGKDNARLSKRHGATAVDQFEEQGILPQALFNYLALLGWAPPQGREVLTREEIVELFDLSKVSRSSAIFDYDKLYWINRQHIKRLKPSHQAELAYPHLRKAGLLPERMTEAHWQWLEDAVEILAERIDRLSALPQEMELFFHFSPSTMDEESRRELNTACSSKIIPLFAEKISRLSHFDYDRFASLAQEIKRETGCKGKALYHPLRLALTARLSGLKLDSFILLVEKGAKMDFPKPIKNCTQRVSEVLDFMKQTSS